MFNRPGGAETEQRTNRERSDEYAHCYFNGTDLLMANRERAESVRTDYFNWTDELEAELIENEPRTN